MTYCPPGSRVPCEASYAYEEGVLQSDDRLGIKTTVQRCNKPPKSGIFAIVFRSMKRGMAKNRQYDIQSFDF